MAEMDAAPSASPPRGAAETGYTLMIVDDSSLIRRQIERMTRTERLRVVGAAGNGEEAVRLFAELQPDLVTMDITMPKMDGIECVTHMLKIRADSCILIISALADKATAIEAIKRGANGFLSKPFSEKDLNIAFDRLLKRVAARRTG
jgi:two-component system chemotaxis response regulator CheY